MIYPEHIIGPKFSRGDIVSFIFDCAELTLRLPIIPINEHNEDLVSSVRDFRGVSTNLWDEDDQGNRCEQLVSQCWSFEDAVSLDDIALARLRISLVDVGREKTKDSSFFDFCAFKKVVLDGLIYSFGSNKHEIFVEAEGDHFFLKKYAKASFDWLYAKVSFDSERLPCPVIFVPLAPTFFLMISLELQSLHYAGRSNPYSDELLKKFESDLFEDFLSHIDLRYTPETIALIESLKQSATTGV